MPFSCKSLFSSILALFLLATSVGSARAEFRLLRSTSPASPEPFHAELEFIARPAAEPALLLTVSIEDPNTGEWLEGTPLPPDQDLAMESALLAVPLHDASAFDASAWSIEALVTGFEDGASTVGADASAAVTLSPARLGLLDGIQVTVEPSRVLDARGTARRAASMRLVVSGPAPAPRRVISVPISGHADFQRLVSRSFLNGHEVNSIPAADASLRARRAVTPPPGDWRATWTQGERLVRVPLASIGASAGTFSQIGALYHDGAALPIALDGDDLWFFAPWRWTMHSRTDSAFLSVGGSVASPAMPERPAFLTLSPEGTEVAQTRTRHYEEGNHYERFAFVPLGTKFFYHRIRFPATTSEPQSKTYELPVNDNLTTLSMSVTAAIYSFNSTVGFDPDHYADLTVEGVALPRVSWTGKTTYLATHNFDLASTPGGPTVSFTHTVPSGTPPTALGADIQLLDWIKLTWTGLPRVDADGRAKLELPEVAAPRRVTIGGLPLGTTADDVVLLDVTETTAPMRLMLTSSDLFVADGAIAVEFEAPAEARTYFLQLLSSAGAPDALVAAEAIPAPPSYLRGIYVRPPEFAAALEPLVSLRGPGLVELDPQAAYNAFNGGQESPFALRQAIRELVAEAPSVRPMPWILLVGHSTLDPRDEMGLIAAPQVPSFIEPSVYVDPLGFMENPVDYPYVLLDDIDQLPDAMFGRIPSRTAADVELAVERIIRHENLKIALSQADRAGMFISSAGSGSTAFVADQPFLAEKWEATGNSSAIFHEVDYAPNYTAMFDDMVSSMTMGPGGAALILYTGHGFNNQWNRVQYMESAKVPTIDTEDKWPVVATFTCLNGYYAFPGNSILTLSEAWLFWTAPDTVRGAIANMAPASVDYYAAQRAFAFEMMSVVEQPQATRPRTVGELFATTQANFITANPAFTTTLHEIILFGDPASSLAIDDDQPLGIEFWAILQ